MAGNGVAPSDKAAFDADKAWGHLLKQCDFGPRVPGTQAHLNTRDYMAQELKKTCDDVKIQDFSYHWKYGRKTLDLFNVIGTQNWKEAKVRVVLTAHWDSRPMSDQDPEPANRNKPVPAANDGASGVAVLLELARAMKGRLPKDLGVMYFMNDGEDLGPGSEEMYLGVRQFVRELQTPKPNYGILLDMIGDKDLTVPMEPSSMRLAPSLLRAFYRHAASIGMQGTFPSEYGPEIEDDHLVLNRGGIPTIDLIDFDYEPWHTVNDTPDKCSAESLRKIGVTLETWLLKNPPYVQGR